MPGNDITLRLVAKDLASGQISKAIGSIDKLAQRGGIAGSVLQGVGIQFGMMLNPMVLATRGLGAVTDTVGDAINAASDLEESQAKVGEVFTNTADDIRDWADDSARAFGLSEQAALEAVGTFGNFIQALGSSEDAAADMSTSLVTLSADLASFNNQSIDDVLTALRSGLAGETEPMRRLGVDISAARLQADALADGIVEVGDKLTETEKVRLRYQAILKDTSKAQGDFARTSDGLANSQRIMAAEMQNALASLGEALLPIATQFTKFVADVVPGMVDVIEDLGEAFNNLNRFLDPNLALQQDMAKEVPKVAEALGIEESALAAYVERQQEYAKAQKKANDARLADIVAIEAEITAARNLTDSIDGQALALHESIGLNEELAAAFLTSAEYGQRAGWSLEQLATHLADNDRYWDEARDSVDEVSEAERRLMAEGRDLIRRTNRDMGRFGQAFHTAAVATNRETKTIGSYLANLTDEARAAKLGVIAEIDGLGPGIRDAINDDKKTVRVAMQNLKWAMQHPFRDEKYTKFLEQKQRNANRLLVKAINEGDVAAANAAAGLVDSIQAELDKLDDQTYTLNVFVDPHTGRRRSGAAPGRASGGPVDAGTTYVVGEHGPEVLHMGSQSGHVTPNHRLGGVTVNINGGNWLGSAAEVAQELGPEIARWMRN